MARFGCRVMAILGTLITCVGYVAGAYSNNIPTLCITLGLFAGGSFFICNKSLGHLNFEVFNFTDVHG